MKCSRAEKKRFSLENNRHSGLFDAFCWHFGVSLSLDQHTDSMDFIFILSYLLLLLLFMDCEPEAIPSIAFILRVRVCTTFARVRLLFDYWIFGLRISFHLSFLGISFRFFFHSQFCL